MRREWHHEKDKSAWGEGPWLTEPDKIQWVDEATGLDCLIVRNNGGALCGYVGVPAEHPAHGKDYNDVAVDVHGGLTFGNGCDESAEEGHGICHIPEPGRPDNVWWLGFDCAHYMDVCPAYNVLREHYLAATMLSPSSPWGSPVYRDVQYVTDQCASLARQLADLSGSNAS